MIQNASPHQKETVLITGASGGIGYELAKCFAGDGYNLILIARNRNRLEDVAKELGTGRKIQVKILAKDLGNLAAADEIYGELKQEGRSVQMLINNAGFAGFGFFSETNLDNEADMIRLNMETLTRLTKLFLSAMIQCGKGRIMNVSSTAAFQPGPLMAVYYATKAYVLSFSEAIANELKGTGVTVSCLCPGPTTTGFQKRSGIEGIRLVRSPLLMDAATVARIGYRGMMKGRLSLSPVF